MSALFVSKALLIAAFALSAAIITAIPLRAAYRLAFLVLTKEERQTALAVLVIVPPFALAAWSFVAALVEAA